MHSPAQPHPRHFNNSSATLSMRSVLMMRTKPPLFLADCELDWSHIWHIKYKYKSINYIKLNLYKSFFLFIRAGLVAHLRGCWARKRGRGKGGEGVGKGGRVKEGGRGRDRKERSEGEGGRKRKGGREGDVETEGLYVRAHA